jgi:hypothetical protein
MKKLKFLFATLFMVILAVSCEYTWNKDNVPGMATGEIASAVQLFDDWKSGNAEKESEQAGGCGAFAYKVDWIKGSLMNEDYSHAGAVITISNDNGKSFDWMISGGYAVCAVIVKAGTQALVYYYDNAMGDVELVAPENKEISHVTFCFNQTDVCYALNTAWTAGTRYVTKGNWATYSSYAGTSKTVNIYAGQSILAGTATIEPLDGEVKITINLNPTFIFYYGSGIVENLKVQGYNAIPAKINPAPGQFANKLTVEVAASTAQIVVPYASYYGIHIDIAQEVPCQ